MGYSTVVPDQTSGPNAADSQPVTSFDRLFDQIINSETFRGAPVMRKLLLYLWQHQGESISEYAIAVDALGRPPDFDSKVDATVRVSVARLRAKLTEFYDQEIEPASMRLTIPLGGHEIQWSQGRCAPSFVRIPALPLWYRNTLLGSMTIGTILAVLCIILGLENRALKALRPAPLPQPPRLWRSFLTSGQRLTIVVPSPLLFGWSGSKVLIRDVAVSRFEDWMISPTIRQMAEKWGPPSLAQPYISMGAAKSAARILQSLENMGQHPEWTSSSKLAADTANAQNTIFLGSGRQYAADDRVNQILKRTNFYIRGYDPIIVGNRHPAAGEASEYREVHFSKDHKVMPELIILLPANSNGTRNLLILGENSIIFNAMLLLSSDGLRILDDQWREAGSPDSWEALIQGETNGETVLRLQPLAIHSIPANFQK